MSWYQKVCVTRFDTAEVEGLFFLDGDAVSRRFERDWTVGMKYPMIRFPSGLAFELWEGSNDTFIVHLFGEMDLPLQSSLEMGLTSANVIAEAVGYSVRRISDAQLELVGHDQDEHLVVSFDDGRQQITDVVRVVSEEPRPNSLIPLLDEASRANLPPLLSTDREGDAAVAQVKLFTPDSGWTWYVTEFDGEDILFGLVIGLEIEWGYFSLTELTEARGPLGLPIERDRHFEPALIGELERMHRRERGET